MLDFDIAFSSSSLDGGSICGIGRKARRLDFVALDLGIASSNYFLCMESSFSVLGLDLDGHILQCLILAQCFQGFVGWSQRFGCWAWLSSVRLYGA